MAADALQGFVDQLAEIEARLDDPALRAALGPGLVSEAQYLVSACRQRFPNRWPGDQRELTLDAPHGEPT